MPAQKNTAPESVCRVIILRNEGKTYEDIARICGIAVKTVYQTVKGKTFASFCALTVYRKRDTLEVLVRKTVAEMAVRRLAKYAA